jgi:signal transduction histidine kinase
MPGGTRTWEDVTHPEDRDHVRETIYDHVDRDDSFTVDYRIVRADGSTKWIQERGRATRDADGAPVWIDGTFADIDELRRVQEERERFVVERARAEADQRALEEKNAELLEVAAMKDSFVASVSHELRTPLTSIRGYLELVLQGEVGALNEEQVGFLSVVDRNADRLLHVIDDLLFVAQVEADRISIEREPVDLGDLAREGVEAARPAAESKEVSLVVDVGDGPHLVGDRARLAQVVDNLVSNAIKFTPSGGRIEVSAYAPNGTAILEVADTGIGIPADEQRRLFERFYRTKAASDGAIPGTGLGLSITKAIAEAHGGSISVSSEEGAGTTFRVELPLVSRADLSDREGAAT